jgi:hypothetical protein
VLFEPVETTDRLLPLEVGHSIRISQREQVAEFGRTPPEREQVHILSLQGELVRIPRQPGLARTVVNDRQRLRYALTVSDESLTEAVRRHVNKAGLEIAVDEAVLH